MPNITHKIGVSAARMSVLDALTTLNGLCGWWTSTTTGVPALGGTILFRFDKQGLDMSVETQTDTDVTWRCTSGPDEWLPTTIEFHLEDDGRNGTALYFTHRNWAEENPFHYHCSMKWASFLLSLKEFVETGQGRPFPDDIQIEGPVGRRVS